MEIIEIKKGYIVACVISRDYGKPRPAVVVQSNLYKNHLSITVCPLTTDLIDAPTFRLLLTPTKLNGLNLESHIMVHIMVDKISAIRSDKIQKKNW
ncbi:pemK-like family protein [Rickettsia hoogstraalii str. RCCE3]|nr:pemK-like family protein [Rickettsia hoogstraalii str. RCCE3]